MISLPAPCGACVLLRAAERFCTNETTHLRARERGDFFRIDGRFPHTVPGLERCLIPGSRRLSRKRDGGRGLTRAGDRRIGSGRN
jgi:hypothetical protein